MAHDIVVVGASAGGVEALIRLVSDLPSRLPAAVFVVLHVARTRSVLPEILSRYSHMPVIHAIDGAPIVPGRIAVAPPDAHVVLEQDRMCLWHGPEENGTRPAIDPLFRSAATVFGERVIGVILTGALDDGVAGLAAIRKAGGTVVIQDPADAAVPSMPRAALDFVPADFVAPLNDIGGILSGLTADGGAPSARVPPGARRADPETQPVQHFMLTCPSCNGALWEIDDKAGLLRFRCHVGHWYTVQSMLARQEEALDRALWAALRALQERAELQDRIANGADARGKAHVAENFRARAERSRTHAETLRRVVLDTTASVAEADEPDAAPELTGDEES
jgi:two-component system chemotaxis response regulator CheB